MLNVRVGQYNKEIVILLRNGDGPVLRGLYYDSDGLFTDDIQVGKVFLSQWILLKDFCMNIFKNI